MSGGYRVYLKNILPRLAAHSAIDAVFCASPATLKMESWFETLPKTTFVSGEPFRFMRHKPDCNLQQTVAKFAPDVVFIPVERYLFIPNTPLVTMVQNMGPLVPRVKYNPLSEKTRYILQRHEAKFALKKADRVIAPSNFVRDFLVNKWKINPEQVVVIHYGATVIDNSVLTQRSVVIPAGWEGRFLFTAGSIEPYRGLEDIFMALQQIIKQNKTSGLVIAGFARQNMMAYQEKLKKWIQRHGLDSKIVWTGALSTEEMSWCYQNSRVFIMTSRVESFSIISLEAMAHGCVCIAADNPPLPEIFTQAARYYPPGNGKSLADCLTEVLMLSKEDRAAIQRRARDRANNFSWDENVQKLVMTFCQAIDSHLKV